MSGRAASPEVAVGRRVRGGRRAFWTLVTPFYAGLFVFSLLAIGWSIYLSFFDAIATLAPTRFVGFDNYTSFLTDQGFLDTLVTFAIFGLVVVPLTMALALGLAMLVHNLPVARGFFRSVFFLPVACSYVVASLVWRLGIFSGLNSGVANAGLRALGLETINQWLTESPYYWVVLVSVRLWLQVGFYMLLFIAGLQRIPQNLYEAAMIDGLSRGWRRFRWITWPQLRPTSAAVLLLLLVAAFQAFDEFYNLVLTIPAARPPLLYVYLLAMDQQDFGRGSAGAIILTLLMVGAALIQNRFFGFDAADSTEVKRRGRRGRKGVAT